MEESRPRALFALMYIPSFVTALAASSVKIALTRRGEVSDVSAFEHEASRGLLKYAHMAQTFKSNKGRDAPWLSANEVRKALTSRKQSHDKRSATGKLTSTDSIYVSYFRVGSDESEIELEIDTGSGDIWIPTGQGDNRHIDMTQSTTMEKTNQTYSVAYYTERKEFDLTLVFDSVSFGGVTAKKQGFGVGEAPQGRVRGIAGLSFAAVSHAKQDSIVQTLFKEGRIEYNLFALDLERGALEIGRYDPKYDGELTWLSVDDDVWAVPHVSLAHSWGIPIVNIQGTLMDSGTTAIVLPLAQALVFWASFPFAQPQFRDTNTIFWHFPCDSDFGDLHLQFGSLKIPLTTQDMILGRVEDGMCSGSVYGHIVGSRLSVMGDYILRKIYTVYDFENKRIGAALYKE